LFKRAPLVRKLKESLIIKPTTKVMKYAFNSSAFMLIRKYGYFAISFLALAVLVFTTYSCKPDDPDPSFFEVTTIDAINITLSTAQVEGQVTVHGDPEITARGICWSTATNPTVSDNRTTEGTGPGNFTSTLTGLNENTVYYARAYATTNNEVIYGNEISFTTRTIEVYISGFDGDRAFYWKNGEKVLLSEDGAGSSIFVSGNDVYVAGGENSVAKYWKNGQGVVLPSTPASFAGATSIFVSENNIYVAGSGYYSGVYQARYWKNGEGTTVTDGSNNAFANSIFVSGNDIYMAGSVDVNGVVQAKYWKNGTAVSLSNVSSNARSIFLSGSDVYVAGIESENGVNKAKYWKNGAAVSLGNSSNSKSAAYSIFVSGSDVYVAGYEIGSNGFPVAKYWKNGEAVSLTDGISAAYANSIFVSGNDVYVAGYERNNNGNGVAKYWKNGVAVSLTDGVSYAAEATGIVARLK
jgi:hypothetical protein